MKQREQTPSSRDFPEQPLVDKQRDLEKALVKDRNIASGGDTDAVHGDGADIGLGSKKP